MTLGHRPFAYLGESSADHRDGPLAWLAGVGPGVHESPAGGQQELQERPRGQLFGGGAANEGGEHAVDVVLVDLGDDVVQPVETGQGGIGLPPALQRRRAR